MIMTENISTYIKELKNIEKNGDRDLTTKYEYLYNIIEQCNDGNIIKEAENIVDNIKKATIKNSISYLKKPMKMLMFYEENILGCCRLKFPSEIKNEDKKEKWYFILKNTYNEAIEYYITVMKYCLPRVKRKNDIISTEIYTAIYNHPVLSCGIGESYAFPSRTDKNVRIAPSRFKYEEKDNKDISDKYIELYHLYKELEGELYDQEKYFSYKLKDYFYPEFKVFFGDFAADDEDDLIETITDLDAEYLEEYSDDCSVIAYKNRKNLPDLKKKYAKEGLLFISYRDLRNIF